MLLNEISLTLEIALSKCARFGLLSFASRELIENLKYFPISNLYISAFPLVRTPRIYYFDKFLRDSLTPLNNLISCLLEIKISKALSTISSLKLCGFT